MAESTEATHADWHAIPVAEVVRRLRTDPSLGLSCAEAIRHAPRQRRRCASATTQASA